MSEAHRAFIDPDGEIINCESGCNPPPAGLPATITVRPAIHVDYSAVEPERGRVVGHRTMVICVSAISQEQAVEYAREYLEDNIMAVRALEPVVIYLKESDDDE